MSKQTISLTNLFNKSISENDRFSPQEIKNLEPTLKDIQKKFKEESGDYSLLVRNLRAWTKSHEQVSDIDKVLEIAGEIRDNFKAEAFVVIGIGGSDLGGRTIHGVLDHTYHNLLPKEKRGGAPQIFFTGDTFDPKELSNLLDYLNEKQILQKTIFNVISKSGTTSETIAAFLIIKEYLERSLKDSGQNPEEYAQNIIATTGLNEKSALFKLNQKQKVKFRGMLPVPDGVGGRFSFASPVGLLVLAVGANNHIETPEERLRNAIRGLQEAEEFSYKEVSDEENIPFKLAAANFLAEKKGKTNVVFYPYTKTLKLVGDWYTQLSTESLQEKEQGQNVIATTGPTGNHSIANGIVGGPNDKIVHFVRVAEFEPRWDFTIPEKSGIGGELEVLEGKQMGFIQNASQKGTEINFTENGVLNLVIEIPKIDTFNLFKLLYFLEVSVAVEGELRELGELTYLQPGVEGYKKETRKILANK